MKKQTLAACLIAAAIITIVSCKWFNSNTNRSSPLIGKWRIDSVDVKKDSGKAALNFVGLILLASQSKDSVKMEYNFGKDSLTFRLTDKDYETIPYKFDATKNELTIQDSINQILAYSKFNDSIISLRDKDNTTLFLKKTK